MQNNLFGPGISLEFNQRLPFTNLSICFGQRSKLRAQRPQNWDKLLLLISTTKLGRFPSWTLSNIGSCQHHTTAVSEWQWLASRYLDVVAYVSMMQKFWASGNLYIHQSCTNTNEKHHPVHSYGKAEVQDSVTDFCRPTNSLMSNHVRKTSE